MLPNSLFIMLYVLSCFDHIVQNSKFESRAIPIDPKADMGKEHNWSLYFQCGYKGAFDHLNTEVVSNQFS